MEIFSAQLTFPRRFTSGAALLCLLPFVLSLWFNAATAVESPRPVAESISSHWLLVMVEGRSPRFILDLW